ncbi:MAG: hypothetical protein KDA44_13680 [Planctomycetales bacterium]|nr:hypothetical protein [Planctomycetales bacterium]
MALEGRHERPVALGVFYLRVARYAAWGATLAGVSLAAGMLGYRHFEHQSWPEAFVNSAMLLSAMGPVSDPRTTGGKIFAGCYAIYCGLVLLFIVGLLVTPVAHRLLHLFHSDPDDDQAA